MLIRGRSPTIVGGSTSKRHRPICRVPAGSRIFKLLSRCNTSNQRQFNPGPTSTTLDQRCPNALRPLGRLPPKRTRCKHDQTTVDLVPGQRRRRWPNINTPANTTHQTNAGSMLGQRRRRRPNIKPNTGPMCRACRNNNASMHRVGRVASADRMMAVRWCVRE